MDERYHVLFRNAFQSGSISDEDRRSIWDLYQSEGAEAIEKRIRKRKFVPFTANVLDQLGFRDVAWGDLRDSYAIRNRMVIEGLQVLFSSFDRFDVDRVVVVENFGAFLAANAEPLWRFGSGDVDLYGDIKQKERIYAAAEAVGFQYEERYFGRSLISTSFHNARLLPEGFYFDIGWFPTARLKVPFLDYKEEAVDWERTRFFRNTRIRLPDKESLLYICMLHISVHNFSRQPDIRLYIDIQNAISSGNVDWEKLMRWAKRDGYTNRIATVAYLSREILDCDIPEKVISLCDVKRRNRLIRFVYDAQKKVLLAKPGALDSLRIEMLAHDKSDLKGLMEIIFPSAAWLRQTFGNFLPLAYLRYLLGVVK